MRTRLTKLLLGSFWLFCFLNFMPCHAQNLSIKDFERLAITKTPKEFLANKDFTVKSDSSKSGNFKLKFLNRATQEIVYVSIQKNSENDTLADIEYFTKKNDEYAKIVRQVVKQGYNPINDEVHYEKRTGANQIHKLTLKGFVSLKGWDYYSIAYSYEGKKLETPALKGTQKGN